MAKRKKPIKVFQFWHAGTEPPAPYDECIERTRATPWIDEYELVRFEPIVGQFISGSVDLLKLTMARDEPWGLFLDADIYLTDKPALDRDDLPYFDLLPFTKYRKPAKPVSEIKQPEHGITGVPHIAAFYVNGCVDWFRAIVLPRRPVTRIGWTQKLLNGRPHYVLPPSCFHHYIAKKGRVGWSRQQARAVSKAIADGKA